MDYEQEIEGLKLLLDAERSEKRRYRELYNKAAHDRDRYKNRLDVLQDMFDDLKESPNR